MATVGVALHLNVEQAQLCHEDEPSAGAEDGAVKVLDVEIVEAVHRGRFAAGNDQSIAAV